MNIVLKSMAIVLSFIAGTQAMEKSEFHHDTFPTELKGIILYKSIEPFADACSRNELSYANFLKQVTVRTFCLFNDNDTKTPEEYNTIMAVYNAVFSKAYNVSEIDFAPCLKHLKFELIFLKDDPINKVLLRTADLLDPFRGEFDLSLCKHPVHGKMDQYYRMLNGCREKNENVSKTEIRFTPLFWIKKQLQNDRALHLRDIYIDENDNWKENAEFGIFMAWGCFDIERFSCIINENCTSLSSKSLGENFFNQDKSYWDFNKAVTHHMNNIVLRIEPLYNRHPMLSIFHVSSVN